MKLFRKFFNTYWYQSAFFTIMQRFSLVFFGLVSYLLLVRFLSEAEMGVWALFLAISTTFEMSKYALLKNGFVTLFYSTSDKREQSAIVSSSLLLNIFFTLFFVFLIFIGSRWISYYWKVPALQSMLFWYIPAAVFLIPFSHWEYLQQANMSFKGIFAAYFARQGIFFLLVLISVVWFARAITLDLLVLFQITGLAVGSLVAWVFSKRYIQGVFSPSLTWLKKLFNYGKFVFGSGICANVFGSLDRYMTASFMSSASVAFYDVSARVNNLIDVPTTAAADILFPKSARASFEEGAGKVRYIYEKMVGILIGLVLPVSIFVFIFAQKIILVIAGEKYMAAAGIIRIAMLYAFLRPVQNQATNVLNSINKPQTTFYLNLGVLVFNLSANYLFILSYGFMGAAYGSLLTTIFSFTLSFHLLRKAIGVSLKGIGKHTLGFYKNIFHRSQHIFISLRVAQEERGA